LDNHNKTSRHLRKSNNYKIADFVECEEWDCPSNTFEVIKGHNVLETHFHALIYKPGLLGTVEIEQMKKVMKDLGFEGDLDVEYVTHKQLNKILKKRYHNLKSQQKIVDEAEAEFLATIQERDA
jgi:hypothetical protein